jgi:hypothetical protein
MIENGCNYVLFTVIQIKIKFYFLMSPRNGQQTNKVKEARPSPALT